MDHDELVESEANMTYWNTQKKAHDEEWKTLLQKTPTPSQPSTQGVNRVGSILSGFFSKTGRQ
jgi:hypothetical protein